MQNNLDITNNHSAQTQTLRTNQRYAITSWLIIFYPAVLLGSIFKVITTTLITRCIAFILITSISGYGYSQSLTLGISDTNKASTAAPINIGYKIILDESKRNIKRTVEIELAERTDRETLKKIAQKIKSAELGSYERTFIAYRIKGDNGNTYWATTHYNPNLEVNILGSTKEEYDAIKKSPLPTENILGSWLVQWGGDYKMVAYSNKGTTYIKSIYSSGSNEKVYQSIPSERGLILQDEGGKERGEYFLINPNGDLEFWSQNGKFYTAPRHKN